MTDPTTCTLKIVIVEDEALVAMLIEDAILEAGHQVVGIADRTDDALRLIAEGRPDLVLCDVKLLDGDSGIDVAREATRQGVPVLFLSGNPPPAAVGRAVALGCLLKPFRPTSLIQAVETALAAAHGHPPARTPTGMQLYF
jgi:DNA-binding response OmpR family regulator